MTKSKSIIANFGALSTKLPETVEGDAANVALTRPQTRVGAGIIGATQRSLSEIREERDRLQALLAKGGGLELDPNLIDPSPFPDRLPDDSEESFEAFKKTIADEGQKVPIQVRTNPKVQSRYQVVYGHRRWRAARELGRSVKALLVEFSDAELVVAQGIENAVRQDLSWIERALFVLRMDQADIRTRDIKAALSIDDAELTRLRAVVRVIPMDVIEVIGRAPRVGRPRWGGLVSAINADTKALARVQKALSGDRAVSSDERFQDALDAATSVKSNETRETAVMVLADRSGVFGRAVFGKNDVRFRVEKDGQRFLEFLRGEIPTLMDKYAAQQGGV